MTTDNRLPKTTKFVKNLIFEAIDSGYPPPNAPLTIHKKGFDHPLIETSDMREALEDRVTDNGKIEIGFFDETSAFKAVVNNYGVPGKIPARPFMSATFDKKLNEIVDMAVNEIVDDILGGN